MLLLLMLLSRSYVKQYLGRIESRFLFFIFELLVKFKVIFLFVFFLLGWHPSQLRHTLSTIYFSESRSVLRLVYRLEVECLV